MLSLLIGMTAKTSYKRLHETGISLQGLTGYMVQIAVVLYLKFLFHCLIDRRHHVSELPGLFLFVLLKL